jgi:hypothetical protein
VSEIAAPWIRRTKCKTSENASASPLTVESDVRLREEVTNLRVDSTESKNWFQCVNEWEAYVEDSRSSKVVLENQDDFRIGINNTSRFESDYMKEQYARIKALEQLTTEKWETVNAAMITLTTSFRWNYDDSYMGDVWAPPVDHLRELLNSWDTCRGHISDIFNSNDEYYYIRILEPHQSGYAHQHLAILTDRDVEPHDFQGLVDSHVKNAEHAQREAHKVLSQAEQLKRKKRASERGESLDLGCVSVTTQDDDKEGIGAYVGAYLGKQLQDDDILDSDFNEKLFYSVMWATGKRRFTMSRNAKSDIKDYWEKQDKKDDESDETDAESGEIDPHEWEVLGMIDSDKNVDNDDEIHEFSPSEASGVSYARTSFSDTPRISDRGPPDRCLRGDAMTDADIKRRQKLGRSRQRKF